MKCLKRLLFIFLIVITLLWGYASSLIGVDEKAKSYLTVLKTELIKQGYQPNYFVISGRRWQLDNYLLSRFGGAAKNSTHKNGQAIDIIVLDVNNDDQSNSKDVDIVYAILDRKIIKDKGGLGSYKNESVFFNRQMIHFDCRGNRARWSR